MDSKNRRNIVKSLGAAALFSLSTDYIAQAQNVASDGGMGPDTVFELRTYHLYPGMQPKILDRFRTKEIAIFKRYGMQPVAYWVATEGPAIMPGGGGTLIYILRHHSREAAAASWSDLVPIPNGLPSKPKPKRMGPSS